MIGFDFSKANGKARLGNDFLSLVETGRFQYFRTEHNIEGSAAWWFFLQAEYCGYDLAEGVPIERGLRWEVNPAATFTMATGETLPIHDDRLLSAALVAAADAAAREGKLFFTTGQSCVIPRSQQKEEDTWS